MQNIDTIKSTTEYRTKRTTDATNAPYTHYRLYLFVREYEITFTFILSQCNHVPQHVYFGFQLRGNAR